VRREDKEVYGRDGEKCLVCELCEQTAYRAIYGVCEQE
jgi:NAD-dependent dihydropyrimidine dehydrogenase PreA subunit